MRRLLAILVVVAAVVLARAALARRRRRGRARAATRRARQRVRHGARAATCAWRASNAGHGRRTSSSTSARRRRSWRWRSPSRAFGSLRADAFCETRPQSPLGEYFLDCLPGTAKQRAAATAAACRVEQTASTIPPDLIAEHHAPALPRALPADPERVRRRPGRPARGPERGDPARACRRCARPRALLRDPGRARPGDPRPGERRRHGGRRAGAQPARRRPVRGRGARHLDRVGRARGRHPPRTSASCRASSSELTPDDGGARRGGRSSSARCWWT